MAKEICISSTPHETRLAIIENDELAEIYYERENEYTLAGSIYKGRVTRVLPGMQSAFVDVGLERDAFLYVTDFLEEQEDSADFERVGGAPRREKNGEGRRRAAARGSRATRKPQPRAKESRQRPAAQDQQTLELTVATPPPAEGRDEESEQGGTRRWRGRRGRRRGVRGQQQQQSRDAASITSQNELDEPAESFSIDAAPKVESYVPAEPRRSFTPQHAAPPSVFLPGRVVVEVRHGAGSGADD